MPRTTRWFTMAVAVVAIAACSYDIPPEGSTEPSIDAELRAVVSRWGVVPIIPMPRQDPELVALGRALFFDPILSGNRDVSCATCHQPSAHGADGLSLAIGTGATTQNGVRTLGEDRQFTPRHAPTLLNQGLGAFYAMWDGHISGARTFFQTPLGQRLPAGLDNILAVQALFPVMNRREMRGRPGDRDVHGAENELALLPDDDVEGIWRAVMARLLAVPEYVAMFRAAYPDFPARDLTFVHAANAIAAFQREEMTKIATPFDRWLARDDAALSTEAKEGALLFFGRARCSECHFGPSLGAQTFANIGVPQIGPGMTRQPPLDLGRGELEPFDFYRFAFRVPGLRNVELTAPYMHNGAYATLEQVIEHYRDARKALREYDPSHLDPAVRALHHGDDATVSAVLATLDPRVASPIELSEDDEEKLIAFLKSLTDPGARNLSGMVPSAVPSGLPVRR